MFVHVRKKIFNVQNFLTKMQNVISQMCKCANVQMCKCANVQKTVVHKMRKSAAQIIFQMQKSQIRKSALCTIF